ncbi:MAG: hypothetical protein IH840_16515 [Candidatus Heimdallarchaeota archaeon]|nr:hypothetical protein [Candidatus Heimdallarchaeota archaeon]
MEKLAELRNDQPSLIHTSIIRAKVKLLRGDADDAENILNKAIKKADDLGLKTFSNVAREELDGLKNKQLKIQSLGDSLKANALKVKELEISKYLDKAMLMMNKDN